MATHEQPLGAPGPPAPPAGPPGDDWRYIPPPPRRSKALIAAGVGVAVLAAAALVVGIVGLTRPSTTAAPMPAQGTTVTDRDLCTALAPLMTEDDRVSQTFIDRGHAGTPSRDAAIPKYRTDTEHWAGRAQTVLDAHLDADPFFKRTLQRFIDDRILLVQNMRPGPAKTYDKETWADSLSALGGPLSVCSGLGVKW
jgi:hypothetical protein